MYRETDWYNRNKYVKGQALLLNDHHNQGATPADTLLSFNKSVLMVSRTSTQLFLHLITVR